MIKLFRQYRPFFAFLGKFFFVYLVLLFVYKIYLYQYNTLNHEVDGITQMVAQHLHYGMNLLGYENFIELSKVTPAVEVHYGDPKFFIHIIEGCNAVSVAILFVAFCVAFAMHFWRTILFLIFGLITLYVLNVFRIGLLTVLLYRYPQHFDLLHDILFPVIIYGYVFILWCLWLFKLSGYGANKTF